MCQWRPHLSDHYPLTARYKAEIYRNYYSDNIYRAHKFRYNTFKLVDPLHKLILRGY